MKKLVLLNIYAFLFWLISLSLSNFDLGFFKYLLSFSILVITLFLPGINLTATLQLFYSKKFSNIEFISLASILALFVAPFLITFEYSSFNWFSAKLPFVNSLVIFALFLAIFYYKKNKLYFENLDKAKLSIKNITIWKFIKSPFFIALILFTTAVSVTFSSFYALPELDPYYWYSGYQNMIAKDVLILFPGYRPLFLSLIYILNESSRIDLYIVFKYVIPLLTLLILIPAQLVAQTQKGWLKKFIILLLPFISASTFLYSQMPIPQAILNILIYYFTLFLLYSWITGKNLFYFASGLIMLLAYYYHETVVLIFIIWLVVTIIFYGKKIIKKAGENTLASFLIITILALNLLPSMQGPYDFLRCNFGRIISLIGSIKSNFLFPAYYINIDNNLMGWGNLAGVFKYYVYYVGPVFFIILSYLTYILLKNQQLRTRMKRELFSKEILILVLSFFCFFSISEILPRFLNIAFLPERAWIFGSIFSIVFLFFIFYHNKKNKILYVLIIISFFINLGGALYINNLKKYIFTSADLQSAEWIKKKLPENRILFSNSNSGQLELYSDSIVIGVSDEFYYNYNVYLENTNKIKQEKIPVDKNYQEISEASAIFSSPTSKKERGIYIFYSKINPKNPYFNRPYYNLPDKHELNFIFDKYPDEFKRIYFDKDNDIIIWKIL